MIPIEKNIFVIDEQGNHYEATYPRRAKGLVKKGRARFVDEQTICLACPPNENLEDSIMEKNRENIAATETQEANLTNITTAQRQSDKLTDPELLEHIETARQSQNVEHKLTVPELLERIDSLRSDMNYLQDVLTQIAELPTQEMEFPNALEVHIVTNAEAMRDSVMARETTIQKLIALYEKMYDDIKPNKVNTIKRQFILDMLKNTPISDGEAPNFAGMIRAANELNFE